MDLDKITFNKFFKQALFLLVLITTGFIIFWELKFFLSCFLGAVTLYVVLRRPMLYLTEKKKLE